MKTRYKIILFAGIGAFGILFLVPIAVTLGTSFYCDVINTPSCERISMGIIGINLIYSLICAIVGGTWIPWWSSCSFDGGI